MLDSSSKLLQSPAGRGFLSPWRLDEAAGELTRPGQRRRLTPKATQVLKQLLKAGGEVVSRQELAAGAAISDESLSRIVNEIREALGDDARKPRFVETIPRRGYRLLPQRRRLPPWLPLAGLFALAILALLALVLTLRDDPPKPSASLQALTRVTSFEGAATQPLLQDRLVSYLRRDARGDRLSWEQVNLDTLQIQPADLNPAVRGFDRVGERMAVVYEQDGQCRVQVSSPGLPAPEPAPCRAGSQTLQWSPDGNRLAFTAEDGALAVLTLPDGKVISLTSPPSQWIDLGPRWSPDGNVVSFVRSDGRVGELYRTAVSGGGETALTADHQMVFDHDWVDAARLLLSSDRSGVRRLWLLDLVGGHWQDLGQEGVMGLDYDAPQLVFQMPRYQADIERWNLDQPAADRRGRTVVSSDRYDNHPRLSPDETRLAFVSMRSGSSALWISAADGADPRLLVPTDGQRLTRPYWIDDYSLLYLLYEENGSSLWQVDLAGTTRKLVAEAWSPTEAVADAAGIIWFLGSHQGRAGLYQMRGDGPEAALQGNYIRLEADAAGQLYLADYHGQVSRWNRRQRPEPVLQLSDADNLHWTAAGQFLWEVSADKRLVRHDLQLGVSQQFESPVPDVIGLGLAANAAGTTVYVARFQRWQVDLIHARLQLSTPR